MAKTHTIKYNFLMNFILSASQIIFPLITFPYISRVLLAEGTGKISFATSVSNYFVIVASLGIPTYGIRTCAQVRDNHIKLSRTVHEILAINCLMTMLVTVTYVICIIRIPRFKNDEVLFLINGLSILFNMIGMNWLFQALEQYDYITIRSILFKFISIIAMLVLVHDKSDYIIYAAITVFASVGSNFFNLIRSRKYIQWKWLGNYHLAQHMKPILILFAQTLAATIYTNLDTVMLGFMRSDIDVGYYNAAVKIKVILVSLVTSLGNVLLPRMSYYVKEKKKEEFFDTMQLALNFTAFMSIPLASYFCIYSAESIDFLAGSGYIGAVLAMQIIIIAIIPIGITGILGIQVLTAIEKEKYVLASIIVGAVIDFTLNIMMIPNMGATGAALSTTIAEFCVLLVQIFYTRKLLYKVKAQLNIYKYILMATFAGTISYTIKWTSLTSSFFKLLMSSSVFGVIYIIGLLALKDKLVINILNNMRKNIVR